MLCALASCHTQHAEKSSSSPAKDDNAAVAATQHATPRRYNELFLEAIRQKEAEHIDAEFELLHAALALCPDAPEANYEMGVLKLSYSTYSDTLSRHEGDSLLRKAVRLHPENLSYKETLGTYLANSADYHGAIQIYEEISEHQATTENLASLIWLYKQSGDYAGAIRSIERLEKLDGQSEALSLEKFQTYIAMKDDEHAYKAIEDLCAEYPLDLRYRVLLGDLYDQHGYHDRAIEIYKDVLTAEPNNSYAQLSLLAYYKAAEADSLYRGLLNQVVLNPRTTTTARIEAMKSFAIDNLNRKGDSAEVLELFHKVLAQPQESRDMAELCAFYMASLKMPADSLIPVLQKILEIEPDYTTARLQLLQIMLQKDNMQQAADICRKGEVYQPGEVTYYYYEGVALYRLGRDEEAIDALSRGAERIDENTDRELASDLYAQLGDVLHDGGRKERAYAAYDSALVYNERNLLCLNNYAYFLSLDQRNLEKARAMSKQTVDAEPDNTTYLDTYAWVLYRMGQHTQARIFIDQMLRLADATDRENASLFDHAGDIYYRTGERKKARAYWQKACSLTEKKADRKRILLKLKRGRP